MSSETTLTVQSSVGRCGSSRACVVTRAERCDGLKAVRKHSPSSSRIGAWDLRRWLDDGSRMSREVHVRFCESPRVRFPRATYPKLLGPQKWTYYHLYVVLDVYSRYVVGWRLEARESATLATEFFTETIAKENVDPRLLTVHSDGGTSMTSKTSTQLFADLGVVKSRSRPHVSNDNPFIESHYKTLKYCPSYPGAF